MIYRVLSPALLCCIACGLPAAVARAAELPPPAGPLPKTITIAPGPFAPDYKSFRQYKCPEWFRDAKLGIWAVWGVCSVPMQGDWNSRNLYVEGSPQYEYHVAHYGHPSKFGYKDLIPLWKAEKWEPGRLMDLYKKAGARYFCALAVFCDNTDYWDSKYHRWNSVNTGPHRDIIGQWSRAARERGLRFGVTEHLGDWWSWLDTSKGADKRGPLAGVPYDGTNPAYSDLYSIRANPEDWFFRMTDLVDRYQPDLFYTDGGLPFADQVGRRFLAHYYNRSRQWHGGRVEAVYTCKQESQGMWVQDLERGVMDKICPEPWQTDTCVGDWHYRESLLKTRAYRAPSMVLQMLADIVSKNGNLLLNFPPRPDGTLDDDELKILDAMAAWMPVNGEAIFGTRPWRVYGESSHKLQGGMFNEGVLRYTAGDIRFTTKGPSLYAIALGWPDDGKLRIRSLAAAAGRIDSIRLLGSSDPLHWSQRAGGLEVALPQRKPCDHAYVLKIEGHDLKPVPLPPPPPIGSSLDGRFVLKAADAEIHGTSPQYVHDGVKDQIGYWGDPRDFVSWNIRVARVGAYDVTIAYSCQPGAEGSRFTVEAAGQKLIGTSRPTKSWADNRIDRLGRLSFERPGTYELSVKPNAEPAWKVIGLGNVTLRPVILPGP
jgi:alpha-L-fucosidase